MEDVITEAAPPSRFLEEDLNIFTPPSPPLPTPFLIFPHNQQPLKPSLLIIALSPSSLALFNQTLTLTPLASLILPELPLSLPDHNASILPLSPDTLLAAVPFPVAPHRAHAVARALLSIQPDSVVVLDSLDPTNFRGKLSSDEAVAFTLETSAERKMTSSEKLLGEELGYYPSGSVVDGLGAAILARCQVMNVRASLCVSWPRFDMSVVALLKGLLRRGVLRRGVLRGFEFGLSDNGVLKIGRGRDRVLHSELYI